MDQTKKRIITLAVIAALVAGLAAMPLLAERRRESSGPEASIRSAAVEERTIESVLIGGGTLAAQEAVTVSVPSAVKLTAFLAQNGDTVRAGDPIASVDRVTVMTAITEVQETLEHLAEELESAREEENAEKVTALAGGTVKTVYAAEGDRVQDIMLEHGALAVLSLDGKMAVKLTAAAAGETVTVTIGERTVMGQVESNLGGELIVTVDDDGYAAGQTVQVAAEDGTVLGSGELYIHSPWKAVAWTGTVEDLKISEGDEIDPGDTLMTLSDTGNTAAYDQLLAQRGEYEALMLELFQMYQTEVLTAPCDGVVSGIDEESLQLLSAGEGWVLTLLANAPNGDDETLYTNYLCQVTAEGETGWELLLNPLPVQIADYLDLSGVNADPAAMTEQVTFDPASALIYEQRGGAWQQLGPETVAPGDVLLFAGDAEGRIVWIVRIRQAEQPETPTDPTEPTEPVEPAEPTEPSEPSTPTDPTTPTESTTPVTPELPSGSTSQPGFSDPSGGSSYGSFGSFGGTVETEPEFALYGLDTVDIASVTPQDAMTMEITVDELDISALRAGQEASVTVDALTGQHFTGIITAIAATGTNNGGSSKFNVTLTLPREADMLAGMTACAVITVAATEQTPAVPVEALVETASGTLIYTGYDEETETLTDPVSVTVGVSDGEYAQITAGLEPGAEYYYASYDTLELSDAPDFGGFSPFGR